MLDTKRSDPSPARAGYTAALMTQADALRDVVVELEDRLYSALDSRPEPTLPAPNAPSGTMAVRPTLADVTARFDLLNERLRGILARVNL